VILAQNHTKPIIEARLGFGRERVNQAAKGKRKAERGIRCQISFSAQSGRIGVTRLRRPRSCRSVRSSKCLNLVLPER